VPVSHALRRLFRVREVEEEQSRLALESAITERSQLKTALESVGERERRGRALVMQSAQTGELCDRLAGMEEMRIAQLLNHVLSKRISDAELEVGETRGNYLSSRMARQQMETLIEAVNKKDAQEATRRNQQELDDWFRSRK
jgi:flagellar biosynthesis chaperone FliJ